MLVCSDSFAASGRRRSRTVGVRILCILRWPTVSIVKYYISTGVLILAVLRFGCTGLNLAPVYFSAVCWCGLRCGRVRCDFVVLHFHDTSLPLVY